MQHDINDLRFFVTIAHSGSLAEAARRLDLTPSAVSQRLQHLEARLGLKLAHRSTRRFSLTEEGEFFLGGAIRVLAELDDLVDTLRERSGEVSGSLSLCGPLGFGRHYLAAAIADFHAQHPGVTVSLTLSDLVSATDADRYDVIVHIGKLADSRMVSHPIAPNLRYVCATPQYLARAAPLHHPSDLAHHACIVLRENQEDVSLWRFHKKRNDVAVRVPAVLSSNDGDVVKQWALRDKGLIMRSEWDVAEEIAAGRLVRVLGDWSLPQADVVAITASRAHVPARVKLFLASLQARFRPHPPWR